MKRLAKSPWLSGTALALFLVAALVGCKQSEGDVCQIDDDCKSGLICNPSSMRCQGPGGGAADAQVFDSRPTPDADTTDADPSDAASPDADTTPDATPPTVDATPPID